MTEPDERLPDQPFPDGGRADDHDLDAAEEYAASVPVDPSPDEVNHYLNLVGDPDAVPESDAGTRPDAALESDTGTEP